MAVRKSWKFTLGGLFLLTVLVTIYLGYFCHGTNCALKGNSSPAFKSNYDAYFAGRYLQNKFTNNELDKDYDLDLENEDVIVFLHIQKTGGTTFGKHLVDNLKVHPPCNCYKRVKKHCDCLTRNRRIWLFSRYSTGWRCGLHADWTELKNCVDEWFQETHGDKRRRYHYITMLRDPVRRFISEWMHVRRGATWKTAALKCNGKEATLKEVPFCYTEENWSGVTLMEFIDCKHNLAFNRQTRMMANLSKVHCYNTSSLSPEERDRLMLQSAKENLLNLSFFGLVEFQTYTQFLFEHTLNMNFIDDFVQLNSTHSSKLNVTAEEEKKIAGMNHLDIELYQYAKDLFLQRVKQAYLDDGLSIPPDFNLLSSKAVEGERKTNDKNMESSDDSLYGRQNNEVDDEERKEAAARQIVQNVFQPPGLPRDTRRNDLSGRQKREDFEIRSGHKLKRGSVAFRREFHLKNQQRLPEQMSVWSRNDYDSQELNHPSNSKHHSRRYR